MRPDDFSLLYQDTDAAPWDNGSCGSQTTFNSARAVLAAAVEVREQLLAAASDELEAASGDLELVGGSVRVKGSPEKAVTIAALAATGTFHGKGAGDSPRGTAGSGGGVRRAARARVLPCPAADCPRGAREGRPRDGRRASPPGRRRARLRADPQSCRGRRPGLRRGGDGDRPGAHRGDAARRARASAQPAPARLQARHRLRCARDRDRLDRDRDSERRAEGLKGVGEPPCVPTAGAIANAIANVIGARCPAAPDDTRAGLGGRAAVTTAAQVGVRLKSDTHPRALPPESDFSRTPRAREAR